MVVLSKRKLFSCAALLLHHMEFQVHTHTSNERLKNYNVELGETQPIVVAGGYFDVFTAGT